VFLYGDWAPGRRSCGTKLRGTCALVNLEGPILPPGHRLPPAAKAGPSLFSTQLPATDGLLVGNLANNHAMDCGAAGLARTLDALQAREGLAVGAGRDLAAARRPVVVHDDGVRVAIIGCCEPQFGTAQRTQPGVAAIGPWVHAAIRAASAEADAVVVSVHAGPEVSPWPAPTVQDLYRSWIAAGAAVVHGHHPHVPQGYEEHEGGVIFYGLGNLAVNPADWTEYPNALWSLAVEVELDRRPPTWRLWGLSLRVEAPALVIDARRPPTHVEYLADCNRPLSDRTLLEGLWQETAVRAYRQYYRGYLRFPPERAARSKRRRLPLMGGPRPTCKASRQDLLLWHHLFGCPTHSDQIATALGVLGGALPDFRSPETTALVERWMPWTAPYAAPAEVLA